MPARASVVRVGQAVQPVINLLRDQLLEAPLVFGDETEVQVLKEPGRKAQAKSYMWAQMTQASGPTGSGPPIRLFAYAPSRSTQTTRQLYAGMRPQGVLMSDGYEPYNAIAAEHRLVHLGCWVHCRRYLNDALQALPKDRHGPEQLPAKFLQLIAQLYKVEAKAREAGLDAAALMARRSERSAPVLKDLQTLLLSHLHVVLPGSLLGKALHYMASQWPKLSRYVDGGAYPIDNNPCENAIRPFVVGRRNWLFADTVAGANPSANLYSLLQACVANGIDGYQYLRALLVALPGALVVGITDGDTLKVRCGSAPQEVVRLAEIDAPEKAQPRGERSGTIRRCRPCTKGENFSSSSRRTGGSALAKITDS